MEGNGMSEGQALTDLDQKQDRHRKRLRRAIRQRLAIALQYAFADGLVRLRAITDEEWAAAVAKEEGEL